MLAVRMDTNNDVQRGASAPADTTLAQRWRRPWTVRRVIRLIVVQACITLVLMLVSFLVGWAMFARSFPDPPGWLTDAPESEFHAADAMTPGYDFDDFLAQEERAFAELDALIDGVWRADHASHLNRFHRGGRSDPERLFDRNWNRTIILRADRPIGTALLIHGLSDAPYSLRPTAETLHERGYTVVVLRVPGHGTCPAALAEASWNDWAAATALAAKWLVGQAPEGAPLVLVGYSNGGALATHYAAESVLDPGLPTPRAVILYSPMIGINPLARVTPIYHAVAWIPAFSKVRWSRIEEEIDPYKFCSWPTNASEQAWAMTVQVDRSLDRVVRAGRQADLPPFLAFQSIVDSTVVAPRLADRLFKRLPAGPNELVLYDVNSVGVYADLLRNPYKAPVEEAMQRTDLTFRIVLVENESSETHEVVMDVRDGDSFTTTPLGMAWPEGVFSLGHGAIPYPPSDPLYGTRDASRAAGVVPLGSLSARGESGVLTISEGLLFRIRHNPFYEFQQERLLAWLDGVVGAGQPK